MDGNVTASPVLLARIAGASYLIVIAGSIYSFAIAPHTGFGHVAGLFSSTANLAVTVLFYKLLKDVNPVVALLAALFNVEGVAHDHDPLAFFGCFCICTGYLIYRSSFIPRAIGAAMLSAGAGLLVNAYAPLLFPGLPHLVSSIGFAFDGVGEISLTLWLILVGVNDKRWHEMKRTSSPPGVAA